MDYHCLSTITINIVRISFSVFYAFLKLLLGIHNFVSQCFILYLALDHEHDSYPRSIKLKDLFDLTNFKCILFNHLIDCNYYITPEPTTPCKPRTTTLPIVYIDMCVVPYSIFLPALRTTLEFCISCFLAFCLFILFHTQECLKNVSLSFTCFKLYKNL